MKLWIDAEVLRLTNLRARREPAHAGNPGPEGSIAKLAFANAQQARRTSCASTCSVPTGSSTTTTRSAGPSEAGLDGAARFGAQDVPALACELDRGRHVGDHAQHPRRAHPRPARRAARRPRPPVVASAAELTRATLVVAVHRSARHRESRRSPTRSVVSCAAPVFAWDWLMAPLRQFDEIEHLLEPATATATATSATR